jgi:hypothetical protein
VGHGDSACPIEDGVSENFPGVYDGTVYKTNGNDPVCQYFMGAVQGKAQKPFLPTIGVVPYEVENVHRMPYSLAPCPFSPAKFQHGRYRASF